MSELQGKRILFAVLNWGLGHSTRSIPLIQALSKKNRVIIASTGRSAELLKDEFPNLEHIDFPDYNVRYTKKGSLLIPFLGLQLPGIIFKLIREPFETAKLVEAHNIDIVISDCRYGVFSRKCPSFFITHQLRFKLPRALKSLELLSEYFNRLYFNFFRRIIVIDAKDEFNLTGDLSHRGKITRTKNLVYIGLLSSIEKAKVETDIDILISVSGPEPQRTLFEKTVMNQIREIQGKKVVVLGRVDEDYFYKKEKDLEIYSYVNRIEMSGLMNRSKLIVSRSGYSTVIEIAALNKKALLIPTLGQTEQEYLASYYRSMNLFHIAAQNNLQLKKEIEHTINNTFTDTQNIPVNDLEFIMENLTN